jgi:hypothetical protein
VSVGLSGFQISPRHARFRLNVSPGDHTIELLADGKHVHGQVPQTKHVQARAGHTSAVVFLFNVP